MSALMDTRSRPSATPSKRTSRAYAANAETAPGFWMIGILWRVLATGVQTGNAICLLDQLCPPGSGPARHAHPQEEGLYVAKGKVSFQAGGTSFEAEQGSFVMIPRHTEHSFLINQDAVLINFYFPAGFDIWLMGSAVPAMRNELPPKDLAPPVYWVTKRLSDDYGGLPLTEERSTSPNPYANALPAKMSRHMAENFWYEGGCWSILADAASTGDSYTVFEAEMPQGLVGRPHIHDHIDDVFYVLEGKVTFYVDNEVLNAERGTLVFVPRGSVHSFEVVTSTARFLNIHTGCGYERLIRAEGTKLGNPLMPHEAWQPRDIGLDRLRELHGEIGLRPIIMNGFQRCRSIDELPAEQPSCKTATKLASA